MASQSQGVAAPATAGSVLAERYRILRRLGSGGMATVLLAEDIRLGRRVAVKRLHTGSPEEAADRLKREARLGASLNHPSLVTVYDAQPDGESLLIVMEFVDGSSLAEQVKHGPLPQERAIEVLRGIAAGLDHVHGRGVVHRDVKPSNVLISAGGQVKLADLGIAKALEDTGLTQSGVVLGTLQYIAPEQLAGEPVGPAADIYALGLIAYEALSGARVRKGSTLSEILRQSEHPPPDLRDERPGTPAAAARLLSGALARDPRERPGSATRFVEDLAAALDGKEEPAREAAAPPPPPPADDAPPAGESATLDTRARRDARRLAVPGALLLAMLALAAILILAGRGGDEGETTASDAGARQERQTGGGGEGSGSGAGEGSASPAPATPAEAQTEPPPAPDESASAPSSASGGSTAPAPATAAGAAAAVRDFYDLAAAGDYDAAEALATPAFLAAIGGCCDQFDTLESVEFSSLEVTESGRGTATVSFSDVATHTDRVDECQGEATLVEQGGWKLDGIAVDCV